MTHAATTGGILGFVGYLALAVGAIVGGLAWHRSYKRRQAVGGEDEDLTY